MGKMEGKHSISKCPACGCMLPSADESCPFCGWMPRASIWSRIRCLDIRGALENKRSRYIILGSFGAVAVLCVVSIAAAMMSDAVLRSRAQQVMDSQKNDLAVMASAIGDTSAGISAANIAGGGYLTSRDGLVCYAGGGRVRCCTVDSAGCNSGTILVEGDARWLNLCDGDLYYVASNKAGVSEQGGARIMKIKDVSPDSSGLSSDVWYEAPTGLVISNLVCCNGNAYFFLKNGTAFQLMMVDMSGDARAKSAGRVAYSFSADDAQFCIGENAAYLFTATENGWQALTLQCSNLEQTGDIAQCVSQQYLNGDDMPSKTCFVDSQSIVYSGTNTDLKTSIRYKSAGGTLKEFASNDETALLTASGEVIFVFGEDGSITWIDRSTGFTHDATAAVAKAGAIPTSSCVGLGVVNEWLCICTTEGSLFGFNPNSEECFKHAE